MNTILRKFVDEPLFDACAALLNHLHISFNEITRTPVSFEGLYPRPLSKALQEITRKVEHTYFIGTVDEASLSGQAKVKSGEEVTQEAAQGRYAGMMVFAAEIHDGQKLTRTELATLTRGFNRIAAAQPVVLFIKQNDKLALATCERSEYTQQWRDGEKLGKVSLLRDINCEHPHRGHIDILESIGDKAYPTFEELYKHWMQVFSSELLTKKFYSELSDWYAWAVQVVRFPNDLSTTDDDEKFNHESCIRLITRLIFVWFLKQKHLIPEEFFDEDYIRDHFIENFDPHDRENMLYNPEKSMYYRLILQNLFFAMLNCPIVEEGKDIANNRRFIKESFQGKNPEYNINTVMRYRKEFMPGGAEIFVELANKNVPFLNGGLFDCLDDKTNKVFYDGFSEESKSLKQLCLPDWLFFGEEVGKGIDLSQWYDDTKKRNVSARGIIDILKRYNFTIEENTPLDQEVSLDPELLGKAFENLLASYNPETKTSARKQTGSFYTPREIVQYMVDESLVAHLKRVCGDELEPQYRALLSYSTEETTLNKEQRCNIMQAIYHCRVLDPACGSGAFPMGMLQQMVHILRQLDPTNEMWKEFMIDIAIEQSRKAYNAEVEEERKARLADIEEAFNRHVNDPDYARKLYLIENCIYGVDIQPIAVQISKLRFFISLVVDQKPSDDATHNFGIRPLPNLESKFVAANTLIPVEYDASLFESTEAILSLKEKLKELNHAIFLAKRNIDKQRIKTKIKETRQALAQAIEDTGFVNPGAAQKLADWDMFEQNTHADFFDAEWMFGVKGGFDIVIANPPYVLISKTDFKQIYEKAYYYQEGKIDLYRLFIEKGLYLCTKKGIISYITPNTFLSIKNCAKLRRFMMEGNSFTFIDNYDESVFEASVNSIVFQLIKNFDSNVFRANLHTINGTESIDINIQEIKQSPFYEITINADDFAYQIKEKMIASSTLLKDISGIEMCLGAQPYHNTIHTEEEMRTKFLHSDSQLNSNYVLDYGGKHFSKYIIDKEPNRWIDYSAEFYTKPDRRFFEGTRIVVREIPADTLICAYVEKFALFNKSVFIIRCRNSAVNIKYVLAILNSKAIGYYISSFGDKSKQILFPRVSMKMLKQLPIPKNRNCDKIVGLVDNIIEFKRTKKDTFLLEQEIDRLVYHLYGLTEDEIRIVEGQT